MDSEGYEEQARELLMQGKAAEALGLFEMGLSRFPEDADLQLGRGMALLDLKRPQEAHQAFTALIERHPLLGDALQGLAESCLALGRTEEAVACVRRACGPDENDADFVHALGHLLFRHKIFKDAEWCYRRALALNRAHGYSWIGLAASLHQMGRRDEAIYLLKNALEDRLPGFWEAYSYLGCMLFDAGRTAEAKKVLNRIPLDELCDPAAANRMRSFLDFQAHPERARVLAEIEARGRAALQAAEAAKHHRPDIVAIGDIHRQLRTIIEIVRYANLLDTGWDCGWIGNDTIVVQTGDVIDRGPDSLKVYETLGVIQERTRKGGGQVIRLVGNHELMVLQGNFGHTNLKDPEGFRKTLTADIIAGNVQAAYAGQGFLFTHAGVRSAIRQQILKDARPKETEDVAQVLAAEINRLLVAAVKSGDYTHPIFQVGMSRGGPHKVGGLFWEDRAELVGSADAGAIKQVFGHSPGKDIRISPSARRIDVDAGMVQGNPIKYLRIRDGKLLARTVGPSARQRERLPSKPKPAQAVAPGSQEPPDIPTEPALRARFWQSWPSIVTRTKAGLELEGIFARIYRSPCRRLEGKQPVPKRKLTQALCAEVMDKLAEFLEAYPWLDEPVPSPMRCWRLSGALSLMTYTLPVIRWAKKSFDIRQLDSYRRLGEAAGALSDTLDEGNAIFPIWMMLWYETGLQGKRPE